jgi:ComF family protein
MKLSEQIKNGLNFFADALTPGPYQCYLCGEEDLIGDDGLCDECRKKLKYCPNPTCLAPLDGIAVGLQYSEELASAIMRFKKGGQKEYAGFFAQYLSVPQEWHADMLVPVPMHPLKKWMREFNHTELLSSYLSHATGIPYSMNLLFKIKRTSEQKMLTDPKDRRRNIRGSFACDPLVKGMRIVLVDDVFTTGATVYECAKVLKRAGAQKVYLSAVTSPNR